MLWLIHAYSSLAIIDLMITVGEFIIKEAVRLLLYYFVCNLLLFFNMLIVLLKLLRMFWIFMKFSIMYYSTNDFSIEAYSSSYYPHPHHHLHPPQYPVHRLYCHCSTFSSCFTALSVMEFSLHLESNFSYYFLCLESSNMWDWLSSAAMGLLSLYMGLSRSLSLIHMFLIPQP